MLHRQRDRDRKFYLGASGDGDDTSEEIPDNRFQGRRQTIYVDGVDQPQAVLFNQETEVKGQRQTQHHEATAGFHTQTLQTHLHSEAAEAARSVFNNARNLSESTDSVLFCIPVKDDNKGAALLS